MYDNILKQFVKISVITSPVRYRSGCDNFFIRKLNQKKIT